MSWSMFSLVVTGCWPSPPGYPSCIGQCGIVLHGTVPPVPRPELPQPQPLGYRSGPGKERDRGARACRLRSHRNHAHTDQPYQNGKTIFLYLCRQSYFNKPSPPFQSAHMAVIEAMMQLFAKETVNRERVVQIVQRFGVLTSDVATPSSPEEALLLWLNSSLEFLKVRASSELASNDENQVISMAYQNIWD